MDPRDTLERLVPEEIQDEDRGAAETLGLHRRRYEFAAEHARAGSLLDLACGVGYGTRMLADLRADLRLLWGVDVSPGAVEYARSHYACDRVHYVEGDAMSFGADALARETFDTIVSLETIEHLADPHTFFSRLSALLAPGGVLVASVPTTPSVDLNPHHLHDFTAGEFRKMGARNGLVEVACYRQVQRVGIGELWGTGRRFRSENLRPNLPGYYVSHPGALARRVLTTLRHGLANHYLTIAWKKDDPAG